MTDNNEKEQPNPFISRIRCTQDVVLDFMTLSEWLNENQVPVAAHQGCIIQS